MSQPYCVIDNRLVDTLKNLICHNSVTLISGLPGNGKSHLTKELILQTHPVQENTLVMDCSGEYSKIAAALGGKVIEVPARFSLSNLPSDFQSFSKNNYTVLNLSHMKEGYLPAVVDLLAWVKQKFITASDQAGTLYIDELGWFLMKESSGDINEAFLKLIDESSTHNKGIVMLSQLGGLSSLAIPDEYQEVLDRVQIYVPLLRDKEKIKSVHTDAARMPNLKITILVVDGEINFLQY